MQLVDYIYKVLTRPDVAPAEIPAMETGRKVRDQRQMHYEMLPHARPGGIAGLLEIVIDLSNQSQGRADIYNLADELAFEIDDLLPIMEAAQILGFLQVGEGDVVITPEGREFAESEILKQKELFRKAALEHVLLLRQITRALNNKSDHTVPEEFFLDMLDEQFSDDETQRQLDTAINWGRYAELFDFDAARRRFILPETEETAEIVEGAQAE
jgi:NitT/TauT family transport system ATP-binding protein